MTEPIETVAGQLIARGERIAVAESSTGGLISAAMLALPGASAWYAGGAVLYTRESRKRLLGIRAGDVAGLEPVTEAMAAFFAQRIRQTLGTEWGIAELGIAGPTKSRYGHDPGISVIAVDGPVPLSCTLITGNDDRRANMQAFTDRAITLLSQALSGGPG